MQVLDLEGIEKLFKDGQHMVCIIVSPTQEVRIKQEPRHGRDHDLYTVSCHDEDLDEYGAFYEQYGVSLLRGLALLTNFTVHFSAYREYAAGDLAGATPQ